MTGVERIAAERAHQLIDLGYTKDHDFEEHNHGELGQAAMAYLISGLQGPGTAYWPWGRDSFKPDADPIRNLERAGALIAAEIDRLVREEGS